MVLQKHPRGGGTVRQIRAVVTVENVDRSAKTITVKGPKGNEYEVYVPNENNLQKINNGDKFTIVYTEGMAVSLDLKQQGS